MLALNRRDGNYHSPLSISLGHSHSYIFPGQGGSPFDSYSSTIFPASFSQNYTINKVQALTYRMRKLVGVILVEVLLDLLVGLSSPEVQVAILHLHSLHISFPPPPCTYGVLQNLGVISGKAVLLNVVHLNILGQRLHGGAQHHMHLSLQISGIVLDQVISKISVSVSGGGDHRGLRSRTRG